MRYTYADMAREYLPKIQRLGHREHLTVTAHGHRIDRLIRGFRKVLTREGMNDTIRMVQTDPHSFVVMRKRPSQRARQRELLEKALAQVDGELYKEIYDTLYAEE